MLALLELASHQEQGDFLQIEHIAANHQIPERYLAQLLMALRRCGLVRSQRGAKGGYLLAQEPSKITMREVLSCLEGANNLPLDTHTAFSVTPEGAAIEAVWQEAAQAAIAVLQGYTLQDLCNKRDESKHLNPMYYI